MQVYFNKANFLLSMEQYLLVKRLKFVFYKISSRHCKAYRLVQYNAHSINAQNQDIMEILKDIVYIVYLLVKYLFSQLIFKCLFKMFTWSYIKTLG